ncbi:MAG TPA: serine/threonine-protein kinase [Polyangiaceae bacterium LLY-WYZ-15_(1-7)]|nr:serine/threonine-protein kinase [Polyangiaceae bacterium LLY-WYZ-15_(1-7)]HJL08352.1 serine/threonine-protein kinase [Polyangiaceae bacterium LLY-WYZ-15_(1-7)]HJL26589.1 serine/threonine-protein kinase [Polyangiaceae bacterium LLY-WYZ-15_(1-7)]
MKRAEQGAPPSVQGRPAHAGPGELPRAFGRYVLFDHIGRGGMADIFLAKMRTSLGGSRNVVVKQVLPHLSDQAGFRAMLREEAKLAAKLNHANVVQVFDFGREEGRLFIAMDYVEGFDLHQLLRRLSKARVPLPAEFALFVIREVLRALDYAHRARDEDGAALGVVHRDVSPSNVLISFEGEVKLCDFGIARAFQAERDARQSGEATGVQPAPRVVGKSAYMSPEHASGREIDARADVFAAGILLWELCAGRRLYKGTEDEMLAKARAAEVPALPERGLPDQAGIQAVLERALARDPDARFATAADFLHELESYAIANGLMASPLRFGAFLTDHFADDIIGLRRAREKAAEDVVDDADPSDFGPSSAPPPAGEVAEISAPPPAALPAEALAPPPSAAAPLAPPPPPSTPEPIVAPRVGGSKSAKAEAPRATSKATSPKASADGAKAAAPHEPSEAESAKGSDAEAPGNEASEAPAAEASAAEPDESAPRARGAAETSAKPERRKAREEEAPVAEPESPLGAPPPSMASSRPPPASPGPLTPFTGTWYALLAAAALAVGFAVYFLLR